MNIRFRAGALILSLALFLGACAGGTPETVAATAAPETQPPVTEAFAAEQTQPSETQPSETQPPEPERFVLTFAGDCTLGGSASTEYAPQGFFKTIGEDYGYPFRGVLDYFSGDDLTLVNLEGPLCPRGSYAVKKHVFRGPPEYVNILTQNSVEAVTIANNHSMDYLAKGYEATKENLEAAGVSYVEQDNTCLVTTASGLKVGLYGMVYYCLDVEKMTAGIEALRQEGAEIIVVLPHWGGEYTYHPTQQQKDVGHAAIDAGADLVIGSHPHVLQDREDYGGGVIFYSLGNFSFGGNSNPRDFDSVVVQQEVIREPDGEVHLGQTTVIPVCISSITGRNDFQPTPYAPDDPGYERTLAKLDGDWPWSR